MNKFLLLILVLIYFNNAGAQEVGVIAFTQADLFYPRDFVGFGGNVSYKFEKAGKIKLGYSYQYADKEYNNWTDYWHAISNPQINLHDCSISYLFGNKIIFDQISHGPKLSCYLVRGTENFDYRTH